MWVAGYCNDVFGYVPSLRVLREGGYEGGDAMIYYGRPGPFTDQVEDLIVREVRRLMEAGELGAGGAREEARKPSQLSRSGRRGRHARDAQRLRARASR